MRLNISVPDALADEVRRRDIPVSAICQRALRDEVSRLQTIERADDILIYIASEQLGLDPGTWPGWDPAKPRLVYGHHPERGDGWALSYELGDEPGDNPDDHFIGGAARDVEWALSQARAWLRLARSEMDVITVQVGEPSLTVGFNGRWLIEPDSDETRTGENGYDAGAYWGVALTKRGRIAVYTAHCNDRWPARLDDYDDLNGAAPHLPADIFVRAAAELGEERVLWRDI